MFPRNFPACLCSALMLGASALVTKTPSVTDRILKLVSETQSDRTGISQRSFAESFQNPKVPINLMVQDVVARANKLAEQRIEPSGICKRDYSACPSGWSLISGDTCVSSSYQGPCSNQISSTLTSEKKAQLQEECSIGYPCIDDKCIYDYSLCPENGWVESADGFCNRISQNQVSCEQLQTLRLDQLTIPEKQSLVRTCGLEFPCAKKTCQPSYLASCPDTWSQEGPICVAPSNYNSATSGCSLQVSTANWTMAEKQQFSVRCKVHWGCGLTYVQNYNNLEPAFGSEKVIQNGAVLSDGLVASPVSSSQTLSPGSFAGPLDFAAMQR
jgi:CPW-WPC domain-containing protein